LYVNFREIVTNYRRHVVDAENIPEAPEIPPQNGVTVGRAAIPKNHQSDWYKKLTDLDTVNSLWPGDLLEFTQQKKLHGYSHWAIYIGPIKHETENGEIIVM